MRTIEHVDDVTRLTEAIKVLESAGVTVPLTGDPEDARKIFTFAMESADAIKRLRDALFPFASAYCEYREARGDDYHPKLLNPELDLCLDVQVKDWETAKRIMR